jgi:uncharacterized membrane protein YjjP (DUF1212 family)
MTREECSDLVLAFARVLHTNGESTQQTLDAARRLSNCLGFHATIFPHWGELEVQTEDTDATFISAIEATPSGVNMDRVASTLRTVEELCGGRLARGNAMEAIGRIAEAPAAPTWLFTLAAAVGAVALAVLFGVRHLTAAALIFGSAAVGAVLRRTVARYRTNVFLQPFGAALLAGVIGALAVRYQLSSSLRLVAVCPCMVLVPGPHFLNGMLDLIRGRMNLGAARLIYAVLTVVAISTGLLLGLDLLGVSLPVDPAGRAVPLWHDVVAAGVAVACYSIFLFVAAEDAPLAGGGRNGGARCKVGRAYDPWGRPSDGCLCCVSHRWRGHRAGLAPLAHALRGHWLRLCGLDDARGLHVQDGKRPSATY